MISPNTFTAEQFMILPLYLITLIIFQRSNLFIIKSLEPKYCIVI